MMSFPKPNIPGQQPLTQPGGAAPMSPLAQQLVQRHLSAPASPNPEPSQVMPSLKPPVPKLKAPIPRFREHKAKF